MVQGDESSIHHVIKSLLFSFYITFLNTRLYNLLLFHDDKSFHNIWQMNCRCLPLRLRLLDYMRFISIFGSIVRAID
jgi:hypothetical protein